jgi:hypothetical protein
MYGDMNICLEKFDGGNREYSFLACGSTTVNGLYLITSSSFKIVRI